MTQEKTLKVSLYYLTSKRDKMIPTTANQPHPNKFYLLTDGDTMKVGDEYYDPFFDEWRPIETENIEREFFCDESKPVRRLNPEIK